MNQKLMLSLIVSNFTFSKLSIAYGVHKVHKKYNKLHLIIRYYQFPTEKLSKWVVKEFNKLNCPKGFAINNSIELCKKLKNIEIEKKEIVWCLIHVSKHSTWRSIQASSSLRNVKKFNNRWSTYSILTDEDVRGPKVFSKTNSMSKLLVLLLSIFIQQNSFHFDQHKASAIHSMIHRLLSIPLSLQAFNKEYSMNVEIALAKEFSAELVNKILKNHQKKKKITKYYIFNTY